MLNATRRSHRVSSLNSSPVPPDSRFESPSSLDSELPLQRIYRWEREKAGRTFLTQPFRGEILEWTWAQAVREARCMATYLRAQGWPRGSHIVILSKNCSWWIMAELAIWMAGHVSVPIYPSLAAESVRKLIEHSDCVACFAGAVDDERIMSDGIPSGLMRIAFPNCPGPGTTLWADAIAASSPIEDSPLRRADEIATLIYTSGTTGAPKGAMHRFASFAYFVAAVTRVIGEGNDDRLLSYLPLAHIAERALVEATGLYLGSHFFFVENIKTFPADLQRARPTVFFSVPRLLTKFQQGVFEKIPAERLDLLLRIPVVSHFVRKKILRALGLDNARLLASGGAPLSSGTLKWYRSIGANMVEGYGMTETGITHTPVGGQSRPGFVGNGVPGVETQIGENGEILVRSPMNMVGYYKDPEGTRQAFTADGFFRTGDLGEMDADGWLKIIGRVKEQFKTSKGKYVSPAPIEHLIGAHPAVEACCVMGAGAAKPFAVLLVTEGIFNTERSKLERDLTELLEQVNGQIEAHERLRFMVATNDPWTIANGLVTPTMKLKRNLLENRYAPHLDYWMAQDKSVIWHASDLTDLIT